MVNKYSTHTHILIYIEKTSIYDHFCISLIINNCCVYTGLAVVFVMMITSCLLVLIMVMIWKTHILLVILYIVTIGAMELVYLSSVLYKFDQGGYLPLVFAAVLMAIMFV